MEKSVTHIALFAALIAILGLIPKIDLISGVPITMQSLGIMLCGTVLGARRGALAVLLFLALVAAGAPLLSGGRGGLGVFAGPSAGYLLGFPVAAYAAGWIVQRWQGAHIGGGVTMAAFAGAVLGGVLLLNAIGILGMAIVLDKTYAQATPLALPFLLGDSIKAALAGIVTGYIARLRPNMIDKGR